MTAALLSLAERCEGAAGGDRELDAEIALAVGWTREPDMVNAGSIWRDPQGKYAKTLWPAYTTSLDAALTLIPRRWKLESLGEAPQSHGAWTVWLRHRLDDPRFGAVVVKAPTPALALCAAALRARAAT